MKSNEGRGEERADGAYVEPCAEALRKKQRAKTQKPTKERKDLEIANGVCFKELERNQDEQNPQARFNAEEGTVGQCDASESESEDCHFDGDRRQAEMKAIDQQSHEQSAAEQCQSPWRKVRKEREHREQKTSRHPGQRHILDHAVMPMPSHHAELCNASARRQA